MSKRFLKSELFSLRNFIPIEFVIEKILKIPSKRENGHFRFQCPHCLEFQTARNLVTNLARCFRCSKNFNTIDLVMLVRTLSFVESVELLKRALKHKPWENDQAAVKKLTYSTLPPLEIQSGKGDLVSLASILRSAGIVSSK
jgi:hypothetical protein